MRRVTVRRPALVLRPAAPARQVRETLAGEEALEIRVNGQPLSVTMRTPGADFDLVAGNLLAEGLVQHRDELTAIRYAAGAPEPDRFNIVDAIVPGMDLNQELAARRVVTTGACGVCGTTNLASLVRLPANAPVGGLVSLATLLSLPERIRSAQKLFEATGGVHAAGLFTLDGTMRCVREDIGRHNAVDKVVGWALREGLLPLSDTVLQVSGRASFELVQKASLAGIPILAAVSAPSSLAVDHALEVGLTLAGFSRGDRVTVYSHPDRIAADDGSPLASSRCLASAPTTSLVEPAEAAAAAAKDDLCQNNHDDSDPQVRHCPHETGSQRHDS